MIKLLKLFKFYYKLLKRTTWQAKIKYTAKKTGTNIYIGSSSSVNSNTSIGEEFSSNGITIKGTGNVDIGDFVHTGCDLLILTSNHNYKSANKLPYDELIEDKKVSIDRAVWIGDRVTILGGVHIGEGAILQAGSVIVNDVPRLGIAGGNPAQIFKYRDEKHFERLVGKNKFLYL